MTILAAITFFIIGAATAFIGIGILAMSSQRSRCEECELYRRYYEEIF